MREIVDHGTPPAPGSPEELHAFQVLQAGLPEQYRRVFPDPAAPRTVLILPSLSLDQDVMARIAGVHHYEERMLCMLLLLRLPQTRVIYVTSKPIAEPIIDYYLHLLPGVPSQHARRRLTLLCADDAAPQPLSAKILARPRLVERIRAAIADVGAAHMTCFNVSPLERTLAVRLGVPIYGCDPALLPLGSKSGARQVFREAGMLLPAGVEGLGDATDLAAALTEMKTNDRGLRRVVVKLNEGFSGEGNAIFRFDGAPEGDGVRAWVRDRLPMMAFEAKGMTWDAFEAKLRQMGGVVETFIEGVQARSPSAQYRIDPERRLEVVSTHDQVLGGSAGQIFLGCRFPADPTYRLQIQEEGRKAAEVLRDRGVLGRFGIDFLSVRDGTRDAWRHYAIEINLRKGGTSHPFLMLQFLTDGAYEPETGTYRAAGGQPRCYYASDNLEAAHYRGLTPEDLIDIAVLNDLHFHGATQEGVVFHLIGALSEFGKLGVLCVAEDHPQAKALYDRTVGVLDREGGRHGGGT